MKSHPIWQSITSVESALDGFSDSAQSDPKFSDLLKKITFVRWVLEHPDPFLFSTSELNSIHPHLTSIINHIPNNANNWAHFPHIEGVFVHIFSIAPYARVQKIFKSGTNAFFEKCESKVSKLKADADTQLEDLINRVEDVKTSLHENSESSDEIKTALEASEASIEGQFGNWETRLDTEIKEKLGELVETFSEGQTKRREEHEKLLNKISEALRDAQSNTDKTLSVNAAQIENAKKELAEAHKIAVDGANEILAKLKNLYGIAGDTALSSDFVKSTKSEGWAYFWLTLIASLFYIAIPASFAYLWINYIDVSAFRFTDLLARLPISAVFLAPAIYFGNLAQRHRRVSVALRSLGIRIAAFDAYLANFSDEEKNAEKQKMTEVFFDAKISSDRTLPTDTKDVGKALDQLTGPLGKIVGILGRKD